MKTIQPLRLLSVFRASLVALILSALIGIVAVLPTRQAIAATNSTMNFQARLMTNSGAIVPDGDYNIEFKIYNASTSSGSSRGSCTGDAACLWTESRVSVNRVRVANGYVTVNLGSVTAFPSTINWDQELWLTMNIGGTGGPVWDGEMTPRLKLTAVPYAFRAGMLAAQNGASVATLGFVQPTANRTILLPNEGGTLCIQSSVNCGFVAGTAANYIQNQNAAQQATSNFWISGNGRADGILQAPTLDTATAVALNIGTTNATVINLNQNTTMAAGKTLTVTSALTSLTGNGTTGDALNVSNSTSTGNVAVFKDNTTTVATIADGGAVTLSNSVNSTAALRVQNAAGADIVSVSTTGGVPLTVGRAGTQGHVGRVITGVYDLTATVTNRSYNFLSNIPAGHSLVGSLVLSSVTLPNLTVTDTAGNTYTVDASITHGSTASTFIFSSNLTNSLTTSDSISLTISEGNNRWTVGVEQFDNLLTPAVDRSATNGSASASLSSGTTAVTTNANELVFGAFGTGLRTFTPGTGFTATPQVATANGSNDRAMNSEWKYVTSTGTQEATATLNTSSTYAGAVVTYKSSAAATGLAGDIKLSDGTSSGYFATLGTASLTVNRTIDLSNESGTICLQNSTSCGFAASSGSANYIQNQNASQQSASNFWISGTGRADTSLQAPLLDTATAVALNIGTTNATTINLNQNTTVSATKNLTVAGGLTSLTANTGDALNVSNSSSTGNIAVFSDNATAVLTLADGGAATFKNQTNAFGGFLIQNATGDGIIRVDTTARKVSIGAHPTSTSDNIVGQLQVTPTNDARIGIQVKAFGGSYSANFIEAVTSAGVQLFNVQSTGTVQNSSGLFSSFTQTGVSSSSTAARFTSGNVSGATSDSGTAFYGSGNSSTSGNTGAVTLSSGNATSGNSGAVTVDAGTASGTAGQINVGATNASQINVGRAGISTVLQGNFIGSNAATGTTGTTEATARTNVTTVTLTAAGGFANNDVIFINNAGQDYYTRIVSGGGTTSLTVSPAVSYDVSASVTKYTIQNIGATTSDYSNQTYRFFQGYFLGGIVAGAGSTVFSDANISSGTNLRINTVSGVNIQGSDSVNAFQVHNSGGTAIFTVNTSASGAIIAGTISVNGIQPAASAGNGTNASISNITGAKGGNTTGGAGTSAGAGASVYVEAGAGGDTTDAASNDGWGGTVFINGGAPGTGPGANGLRGNVILQADGGVVGINTTSPNFFYGLDVNGDINVASGRVYRINGTSICSASGCTPEAGSSNYIQNQNAAQQATSNFWISGNGRADGILQAPTLDTATAVALNIGTTNATVINLNENVTIASGKTLGIRTSAPSEALTVNGNFNVRDADSVTKQYRFRTSGGALDFEGGGADMYFSVWSGASFTGTQYTHIILDNSSQTMWFPNLAGGTGSSYDVMCIHETGDNVTRSFSSSSCNPSSRRYKDNIRDLPERMGLEAIHALRPVTFTYKGGDGDTTIGLIAEEVFNVLPELVNFNDAGQIESVDYEYLVANLVKGVQQQQVQINSLRLDVDSLRRGMWNGGLVSRDTTFNSLVTFNGGVTFKSDATFEGKVNFKNKITYNEDTAGTVTIPKGETKVEVKFKQPYERAPLIAVSASEFVTLKVTDKTKDGFIITIRWVQQKDIVIDWVATQIAAPNP